VYDFRINPTGTFARLLSGSEALMPARYYMLQVPRMISAGGASQQVARLRMVDVDHFANRPEHHTDQLAVFRTMINHLFPVARTLADPTVANWDDQAEAIRQANGFDAVQHEQLREDLIRGRIGLARNRLPVDTDIQDVEDADLIPAHGAAPAPAVARG